MHPLLQINDLDIDFKTEAGKTAAVNNITFTINRNEIVGIAGESGSGKSVTALSIARLLPPTARYTKGEILFSADGQKPVDILKAGKRDLRSIRGKGVAMVFQEPMTSLNPVLTCGAQVAEAVQLHLRLGRKASKDRTLELFANARLPDPRGIFQRYPHQLSGGQRQRVMIAMAMSGNPALLICDEPTTALDATVQQSVLELIKDLQRDTGMGVLFITHDLGLIASLAQRTIVMQNGMIVEQGKTAQLFEAPGHAYTKALLACRPVLYRKGNRLPVVSDFMKKPASSAARDGAADARPTTETEPPQPGSLNLYDAGKKAGPAATGTSLGESSARNPEMHQEEATTDTSVTERPLVRVEKLSVWYPSRHTLLGKPLEYNRAVDEVSFEIFRGETLGLVGESGCGKTTLGRALLRLIEPSGGKILYDGRELLSIPKRQMKNFRKNIQIVFQDPYSSLNPSIRIGPAIEEALAVHEPMTAKRHRRERVVELLEKVNLQASHYERYPHEFSGGQRQRIVIARALILNPSFIVCDESVSALDVSVQAQILNLLNDLKKEFRFTNLFISHDLAVVRYISDRIMVMNRGKIVETGPTEEVYRQPASEYTKKLIEAMPESTF